MAFTSLNNKRTLLATVLSEICIGINERRAAIDCTLINFVIDRTGTTATYPDPDDLTDLRYYGQEFANIQQQITNEIKTVSYTSSTGGTVTYVSSIPDYTGTLSIASAPQDTITDTLDPAQWAWYITEMNKKIYVRILPTQNGSKLSDFTFPAGNGATYDIAWNDALSNLLTDQSVSFSRLQWKQGIAGVSTPEAYLITASSIGYKTANYSGTLSDGRLVINESRSGIAGTTTEDKYMEYSYNSYGLTSTACGASPSGSTKYAYITPTQGSNYTISCSIDNVGTTAAFSTSVSTLTAQVDALLGANPYSFHSDLTGELTDQA